MADYASLNKVILVGRIVDEVKTHDTKRGTAVAWFTMATDEVYPQGKKPKASFHRIVCFGKKAEFMLMYSQRGKLIAVEGKLHNRSWEEEGKKRSINEVWAEQIIILATPKREQSEPKKKEKEVLEEPESQPDDEGQSI